MKRSGGEYGPARYAPRQVMDENKNKPQIQVNKANTPAAAPSAPTGAEEERKYTLAEIEALMKLTHTNPGAVHTAAPAQAQVVHIRTDGGPAPIQVRAYVPDHSKRLKEDVTFVIHQAFHLLWPLPGIWETPTNEPIFFKKNGTHLVNGSLLTECFFSTSDPVYVKCVMEHPEYGTSIHKKGVAIVSEAGLRARAYARHFNGLEGKNMTELRNMAGYINKEAGEQIIAMSDHAPSLRAEICAYQVEQELKPSTAPKTAKEFRSSLVTSENT